MELAGLEEEVPSRYFGTICPSKVPGEEDQTGGVEEAEDGSHN